MCSFVQMVTVPNSAGAQVVAGAIYHLVQGLQTVQPTHYFKNQNISQNIPDLRLLLENWKFWQYEIRVFM